ncbi:MFS transporter [Streptomyces sp. M19]
MTDDDHPATFATARHPARPDPWRASRDFRVLWCSGLITTFGSFMALVAMPLQIKDITDSALAVGVMGAVELIPMIVFGLYGGALADAVDRRTVILLTEGGLGLLAVVLLVNTLLPDPMLWPIYLVGAGSPPSSASSARHLRPWCRGSSRTTTSRPPPLNSLRWQVGAIAGPSTAGLVVAYAGSVTAYAITAAGFACSVLLCLGLAPARPRTTRGSRRCAASWRARATPGADLCCSARTPSTWRRCSSPSRTRSFRSSRTTWTPTGRWA